MFVEIAATGWSIGVRDFAEVIEGIDSGGMAIRPDRLDGVAADIGEAKELERLRAQWPLWAFINVAHDVLFALAARARAATAQFFEGDEAFAAVIPLDGEFTADGLHVQRPHGVWDANRRLACVQAGRAGINIVQPNIIC